MSWLAELTAAFQAGAKPRPTRRQPKTKRPFRRNPWPKCQACWHRVDPRSLHPLCRRAWEYGAELPLTHPRGCCPGECRVCLYCLDLCEYSGNHPKDDEGK